MGAPGLEEAGLRGFDAAAERQRKSSEVALPKGFLQEPVKEVETRPETRPSKPWEERILRFL